MRTYTALLVLAIVLVAPSQARALEVRTQWKVLAIGCDVGGPGGDAIAERAARRMERMLERALPGLEVGLDISLGHTAGKVREGPDDFDYDATIMGLAVSSCLRSFDELEDFDLVIVFSDRVKAANGWMGHTIRLPGGRALAVCCVCTRPSSKLERVWTKFIPAGPLRNAVIALRLVLEPLLDTELAREVFAADVAMHEFGHHLQPGESPIPDRHDGSLGAGIADGEAGDNPDRHGPDCVMYKTLSLESTWARFKAHGPDLAGFCDRCRGKLGAPEPRPWWRRP